MTGRPAPEQAGGGEAPGPGDRGEAPERGGGEPAGRPLRRDAERNRRRILDAARELFAERGLAVTLNDIAHHAGVGVGTVYRRFPDKTRLIDELFEEQIGEMVALMEEAVEDPDPWHGLTSFLTRNLEFQARDRALREIVLGSAEGARRLESIRARMMPLGSRLLQRAKDAGALRPDVATGDIPILLLMLTTVIDSAMDVEPELWRRYLEVVIQGLRADPDPPGRLGTPALEPELVPRVMTAFRLPRR